MYYVANNRLPTKRAHGIQIVRMCEAFQGSGFGCTLVVPDIKTDPTIRERNILKFYGVRTPFPIIRLPSLDLINWDFGGFMNRFLFWIQQMSFAWSVRKEIGDEAKLVYSRDPFSLYLLRNSAARLIWEAHKFPTNIQSRFYRKLLDRLNGLVVISEGLREDFAPYYENIFVSPDAVDVKMFDVPIDRNDARTELRLSQDKKIVLYAGQLSSWKGVDILSQVVDQLDPGALLLVVGGSNKDRDRLRQAIKKEHQSKIELVEHVPHTKIPLYLKAADCLVAIGTLADPTSSRHTSPLKIFEYMAARRPIVASRLPSFLEILNEENAILVTPDNPNALADGINRALREDVSSLVERAFSDVEERTWDARARSIITYLEKTHA